MENLGLEFSHVFPLLWNGVVELHSPLIKISSFTEICQHKSMLLSDIKYIDRLSTLLFDMRRYLYQSKIMQE